MRKFKPYRFIKTYIFDWIFKNDEEEIKIGYLNEQGFLESNHAKYLDGNLNLLHLNPVHLNFLVLSETWLNTKSSNQQARKVENS